MIYGCANVLSCFHKLQYRVLGFLLAFACFFYPSAHAESALPPVEYQVKASLIFNFLSFVSWPPDSLDSKHELNICIIGPDVYGKGLRTLEGEMVQGQTVTIKVISHWSNDSTEKCQVMIFTEGKSDALKGYLKDSSAKPVLTIGESPRFLEDGGVINLLIVEDRVGFEVNLMQAKLNRLNVSTKLLGLAKRVVTAP